MAKKVLILNGSPRREGLISQMLALISEDIDKEYEQETFFVNSLNIKPCIGCMNCRSALKCALPEDDATCIAEKIKDTDILVIGSPCYWGNMNGQLKVLFDRMVYVMMGERENGIPIPLNKGKRAIIVSTCNTIYPFNIWFNQTRGVVKAVKEILKWSGIKVVGTLQKAGCRKNGQLTEREIMKCKKLARKI
jgi:NAD(P)H-dependent FMN reductase